MIAEPTSTDKHGSAKTAADTVLTEIGTAEPVTDKNLAAVPAKPDQFLDMLNRAIEVTGNRCLTANAHSPWQIFQSILAMRRDCQLRLGDTKVNAIEWLSTTEPRFDNQPWMLLTPDGAKLPYRRDRSRRHSRSRASHHAGPPPPPPPPPATPRAWTPPRDRRHSAVPRRPRDPCRPPPAADRADRRGLEQAAAELAVRVLVTLAHAVEGNLDGHSPVAVEAHRLGRRAVQLDDIHGSRLLVQTVDVLGHDDRGEACALEPGHRKVRSIRLRVRVSRLQASAPALQCAPIDRSCSSRWCSASGRWSSRHRSALENRGCPNRTEIPAPVKTRMRRAWRNHGSAAARPEVAAPAGLGVSMLEFSTRRDSLLSSRRPRIESDDRTRALGPPDCRRARR